MGIGGGISIGVELLRGGLTGAIADSADHIGQVPRLIGRDDRQAEIVVEIAGTRVMPIARDVRGDRSPAAIWAFSVVIQRTKDEVAGPLTVIIQTMPGSI